MSFKVYCTNEGTVVEHEEAGYFVPDISLDMIFTEENPYDFLGERCRKSERQQRFQLGEKSLLPPIAGQEIWAAGVTYYRSRAARMEEAKDAGGGDFYDRVYTAERPELFFKGTSYRTAGHLQEVRIRRDSRWNVPEPELTLAVSDKGRIFGYTIGNDMSSRDIEGENPLYLPQAKVYNRSCSLGPCIYVTDQQLKPTTRIHMRISRGGTTVVEGETQLKMIKRPLESLVEYLYRDNVFPRGSFLMTGTGIVPPDTFSLKKSDSISITIDCIGTLVNTVG